MKTLLIPIFAVLIVMGAVSSVAMACGCSSCQCETTKECACAQCK